MSRIEGIVKDRYTEEEIRENIISLIDSGIVEPGEADEIVKVAREFYYRGLVHARAEEEKVEDVRGDFGY
jgi:ABC-type dipeptide/oligopeptide/nickel transport system ATPase component